MDTTSITKSPSPEVEQTTHPTSKSSAESAIEQSTQRHTKNFSSGDRTSPKDRRDRLFRKSRPLARRLEIFDGEQYSKDIAILWAAYKAGSFPLEEGLGQGDFISRIEAGLRHYSASWIMDDDSTVFSSKRGPVGMVSVSAVGMIVEPRFVFFKWATKRNMLRSVVAFLNMIRHSKKTGLILTRVPKEQKSMPDHLKKYDMLHFIGKGSVNEYLYSVRGRGSD